MNLDGGVRVVGLKEGEPVRDGALCVWNHFRGDAVSLRVLELDGRATLRSEREEEVLYVLERDTAIHLPAGTSHTLEGVMTIVSVRTPAASDAREPFVVSLGEVRCSAPATAGTAS